MKITEAHAQAALMRWTLDDLNHSIAVPNSKSVYPWECDLLSVTRAGYVHEYEIKLSRADFLADKKKRRKHQVLANAFYPHHRLPIYFWYVTYELVDLEIPEYAGWIELYAYGGDALYTRIKKPAPRLHKTKVTEKQRDTLVRANAYRLKNMYLAKYNFAKLKS